MVSALAWTVPCPIASAAAWSEASGSLGTGILASKLGTPGAVDQLRPTPNWYRTTVVSMPDGSLALSLMNAVLQEWAKSSASV